MAAVQLPRMGPHLPTSSQGSLQRIFRQLGNHAEGDELAPLCLHLFPDPFPCHNFLFSRTRRSESLNQTLGWQGCADGDTFGAGVKRLNDQAKALDELQGLCLTALLLFLSSLGSFRDRM